MSSSWTLNDYLSNARNALLVFGGYRHCENEDAISFIANQMMIADNRYKDGIGSREGYRWMYAKFGVRKWLNLHKKAKKNNISSIDIIINNDTHLRDVIPSDSPDTHELCIVNEIVNFVNNNKKFNKNQKECFNMYYFEGLKMTEIADRLNITKQAVSFALREIEKKLRKKFND